MRVVAFVATGFAGFAGIAFGLLQVPEVQRAACANLHFYCQTAPVAPEATAAAPPLAESPRRKPASATKSAAPLSDPLPSAPLIDEPAAPPVSTPSPAPARNDAATPPVLTGELAIFLGKPLPATLAITLTDIGDDASRAFEAAKLAGLTATFMRDNASFGDICRVEAIGSRSPRCNWSVQGDLLKLQSELRGEPVTVELRKAGSGYAGRVRWNNMWFVVEA